MSPYHALTIAILGCAGFSRLLASKEAQHDFYLIKNGLKVYHGEALFVRCLFVGLLWSAAMYFLGLGWSGVPILLTCYGVFSYSFRRKLNELRRLPPWYVSPGNGYDLFFIKLAYRRVFGFRPVKDFLWQDVHQACWPKSWRWYNSIHSAGRLASHIEITSAIVGAAAAFVVAFITAHNAL